MLAIFAVFAVSLLIQVSFTPANAQKYLSSDDGYINKISVIQIKYENEFIQIPKQGWYNIIFEACAGSKNLLEPEAIIISDSDSKKIKLSQNLNSEKCQMSSIILQATSMESIFGILIENGGISDLINDLQVKIAETKDNLLNERINLKSLVKEKPKDPEEHSKKVSEVTNKIIQLKKELKDSRDLYYKILYLR